MNPKRDVQLSQPTTSLSEMTRQEFCKQCLSGTIAQLEYGFCDTPLGRWFAVTADERVCELQLAASEDLSSIDSTVLKLLESKSSRPTIQRNDKTAESVCARIFTPSDNDLPIQLLLVGTPFQHNVWRTLLSIPFASTISYGKLAELAGNRKAVRAVASAVARNPIGYIIPCHRIVREGGAIGQFRWGSKLKSEIIEWESMHK